MTQPGLSTTLAPSDLDVLVQRSAQGDTAAFTQLYDAVAARVEGLVSRIVGDAAQAEEVAHEVLLEIWHQADTFDASRGSAAAWVLALTHRRAVDSVRARDPAARRETVEAAPGSTSAAALRVRTALSRLPAPALRAVQLGYLGGFTHAEIATLTGVPLETAAAQLRDGLLRLSSLTTLPAAV